MSDTDTLYCSAIYAADQYPDYFGGPIPPRCTPWGLTVRCKKAAEGIFFLETNCCEWVLALAYPVWSVELSDAAQRLGERCELDKQMGEDEAEKRGCNGAPDAVIEILSQSTAKHDRFTKLHLYRKAGVKEYWIVDPAEKSVQVCLFEIDAGPAAFYTRTDIAKVNVLQGCFIELGKVFPENESN